MAHSTEIGFEALFLEDTGDRNGDSRVETISSPGELSSPQNATAALMLGITATKPCGSGLPDGAAEKRQARMKPPRYPKTSPPGDLDRWGIPPRPARDCRGVRTIEGKSMPRGRDG